LTHWRHLHFLCCSCVDATLAARPGCRRAEARSIRFLDSRIQMNGRQGTGPGREARAWWQGTERRRTC